MKLSQLSKPQSDAAQTAARILCSCSSDRADDRARYRDAKAKLAALLPVHANVNEIINEAVRRDMLDAIAVVCAGLSKQSAMETV